MGHESLWARVLDAASATEHTLGEDERVRMLNLALELGPTITEHSLGCSITQAGAAGYATPAASNRLALELDLAQYVHAQGPCVAACREGTAYAITAMADEQEFPEFIEAARQFGVSSSLSLPLPNRRATALNLYAATSDAFGTDHARSTAALLARCVGQFLPESVSEPSAAQDDLRQAIKSRSVVARAQALLAAREQVSPEVAFELMIVLSLRRQRSMAQIASDTIASTIVAHDKFTPDTLDEGGS